MLKAGSYRIFISYAREDGTEIALRLRNDLDSAGHEAWLDLAEIAAGASWARDIEEAIENCNLVLALMSTGSYVSDICRGEQLRALRKGKRLVPLLIQADADRPLHLEHLNYVDFSRPEAYDNKFADLLNYIMTGQVLPSPPPTSLPGIAPIDPQDMETQPMPPIMPPLASSLFKRDARAFRRYLTDLRDEPWLGERHWWTYFLFYYADVQEVADILAKEVISAPPRSKRRSDLWDQSVRLNFRPRTPDLWGREGVRPAATRPFNHCAVPVYLLFDLESVITLAESRFTEGDVTLSGKTFKAASSFRDLPFHLIYHDTWLKKEEREEILNARRAQVLVPDTLTLEYLTHIICRSDAERDTLLALLPEPVRRQWQAQIAVRPDYNLFNNKWVYVERATLSPEGVYFEFNICESTNPDECEPFTIRAEVTTARNDHHEIEMGAMSPGDDLALDLTHLNLTGGYRILLFLDNVLAYAGQHQA